MIHFQFSEKALKEWERLDQSTQKSLKEKLLELKNPILFEHHIKPVVNLSPVTHRIRIGYYRFLIKIDSNIVTILSLGHWREIYK